MSWLTSIGVDVGWPLVLYALFFVALVPLLTWRSKFPMSAGRRRWVTLLRMIAIALAVLSVAGLRDAKR